MKIIGKNKEGFIVQASSTEMANLVGHSSAYDVRLDVGDEIKVAAMFSQLQKFTYIQRDLKRAQETLVEMAGALDVVLPVVFESVKCGPDVEKKTEIF